MADLFATLDRLQILPLGATDRGTIYVEHRTAEGEKEPVESIDLPNTVIAEPTSTEQTTIRPGDRVVIRYIDTGKTASFTLSNERSDPINGIVSVYSPLGKHLIGLAEEDEAEFEVDGQVRRVLVVHAEPPSPVN